MTPLNLDHVPMIGGKPMYYRLDENHEPVPASRGEFTREFEDPDLRRVRLTKVGEREVSTVFLALDHQFGDGPPLLFETMVFGGDDDQQWRYSTWNEAIAGHRRVVRALRDGITP